MFSSLVLSGTLPLGDFGEGVVEGRLRLPGLDNGMSVVAGADGAMHKQQR